MRVRGTGGKEPLSVVFCFVFFLGTGVSPVGVLGLGFFGYWGLQKGRSCVELSKKIKTLSSWNLLAMIHPYGFFSTF